MLPQFLNDYLDYLNVIRGLSDQTIKEYGYDLARFLRYIQARRDQIDLKSLLKKRQFDTDDPLSGIDIRNFSPSWMNDITLTDFHAYLGYIDRIHPLSAHTRLRKISSFRTFFKYLTDVVNITDHNVTEKLDSPKIPKRQPVYLTLSEVEKLLYSVNQTENEFFRKRNLAILMVFLTTGMRLSELVGIDIHDLKGDQLSIIGKGNKERMIYISKNVLYLIEDYMLVRPDTDDESALFLSMRKQRMQPRSVQHMIDTALKNAGFDTKIYSTHKLRHTAATLMHKYGEVDIRTLQTILGHESIATTEIYTHIDDDQVRTAIYKNPLTDSSLFTKQVE